MATGLMLIPMMVVGAACGPSTTNDEARSSARIGEAEPTVGTNGTLIPIESDNVAMAAYHAEARVMTVLFDSGGLYEYYEVPTRLWEEFLVAQPDPWSSVGYPQLVQGGYRYREIGE